MTEMFLPALPTILAATESAQSYTATEFDWPQSPLGLTGLIVGFGGLFIYAIWMSLRDSRELSDFFRTWLLLLRLGAIVGLLIICLNPQERTQRMSFRPSRVAFLVDTSLSMRFPATADSSAQSQSRAGAVRDLLKSSDLIPELRKRHDVSVYTFDSSLQGPHGILPSERSDQTTTSESETTSDSTEATASTESTAAKDANDTSDEPAWDELIVPKGRETRLGESLNEMVRDLSGRTLSGIVVISDGGANAGIDVESARDQARREGTRLLTVGVGSSEPPVNLSVASIQAPTDVHIGDPYDIRAFIQNQGMAGQSAKVDLLMRTGSSGETTQVDSKTIALTDDGAPAEVVFSQTPAVAGNVEFVIRATSQQSVRELTPDDNERRKLINIFERKTRVLIIAGGPMRDFRFVRNMVFRHPAMQSDVWLQTVDESAAPKVSQESDNLLTKFPEDAAKLFEYDAIIAFDTDWSVISSEQQQMLADWVSRHAGGLILVAGDVFTPELAGAAGSELVQELFPVYLNPLILDFQMESRRIQPWTVKFTPDGEEAGFLSLTDDSAAGNPWEEFDGVYRCYPTGGPKAGATVFAEFSDPTAQTENGAPILLASQYYGSGRTLFVGTPELWRLRSVSDEYFDRFWTRAVREVAQGRTERGQSRGLLLIERDQYVLGQTIRIRAQLYDAQMADLIADSIPLEIYDPDGNPLEPQRSLLPETNRPGQFVGSFRAGRQGTWKVVLPVPDSNDKLISRIEIVPPNLETDHPEQNAALLSLLATETGGEYFSRADAATEIPKQLTDRSEQVPIDERLKSLWDRSWVMYLLIGLLSLEWLSRKLLKLA